MAVRSLANVAYAFLTDGQPPDEVERIDEILEGNAGAPPASPSARSQASSSRESMRALMAAAKMPQVGGPAPRARPQGAEG